MLNGLDTPLGPGGIVAGIVSIVFGIVVIAKPKVLAYLVGAYLILVGVAFFVINR